MADGTEKVLNGLVKSKLQASLPNIQFVNPDEIVKYACCNCGQLALYHYVATCEHIFCSKCHGKFHMQHCPIENCTNKSINKISQNLKFEFEVYNLRARCKFQKNGCEENVPLAYLLVHQNKCKFSYKNLLPKVWVPPSNSEHTKQLEDDINILKSEIKEMHAALKKIERIDMLEDDVIMLKSELGKKMKTEEIDEMKQEILVIDEQVINEKIVEKSSQLKIDISFGIARQMTKELDSKTKEINEELRRAQIEFNRCQNDLALNLTSKFNVMSEEMSHQLLTSIEDEKKKISLNAKLTISNLEDEIQRAIQRMNTANEEFAENLALKVKELSEHMAQISDQDKRSFSAMLDATAKEIKLETTNITDEKISKEVQELRMLLDKETCNLKKEIKVVKAKIHADNTWKDLIEKSENENKIEVKLMKAVVKEACLMSNDVTQFRWRIFDWRNVQSKGNDIYSQVSQTRDYGIKMKGKISFTGEHVYPLIEMVYDGVLSKSPAFTYYHRRTFEISIQRRGGETRKFKVVNDPGFGGEEGNSWMANCHGNYYSSYCNRLTADTIDIRVIIEPLDILYNNYYSKNGILIWKLENYKQTKTDGIEYGHTIWSEYFYTVEGFRFNLGLKYSVDHICLIVFNVHGESDDVLQQSRFSVNAMVLQQSGSTDNDDLVLSDEFKDFCSEYPFLYISRKCADFENATYLKDDNLLIKVIIKQKS